MLTEYINKKLNCANYKMLENGTYFGKISGLQGVWANETNLEQCREALKEILEEWLILKLQDNDKIPGFKVKKTKHQYQQAIIPRLQYA